MSALQSLDFPNLDGREGRRPPLLQLSRQAPPLEAVPEMAVLMAWREKLVVAPACPDDWRARHGGRYSSVYNAPTDNLS